MSKFSMSSAASKGAVKKAQEKGGSRNKFKMQGESAALLLVGPVGEGEPVFGTSISHIHFGSDKSFICKSASPEAFGKKDKLVTVGWKLRNKFDPKEGEGKPHPNKKIKELWRSFMSKKQHVINVLDLNDIEKGVQQYDAPMKVMEVIFDEINDLGDDLTTICDFSEGRRLLVKKQGKGLLTKYVAKFSTKTAGLDLSAEEIDKLAAQVKPLSKCQEPFDEAEYERVVDYCFKKAEKLGVNLDELDSEDKDEEIEDGAEAVDEFGDDDAADEIVETDDDAFEEEIEDDEPTPVAAKGKKK